MKPCAAMLLWSLVASLVPATALGAAPEFGGFITFDKRYLIGDGGSNGDSYAKSRLELGFAAAEDTFLLASVELRYYDLPLLEQLSSTSDLESGYPAAVLPWEAYIALDRFLSDALDVKIGKQRIAWGRADNFNPTDNLNPDDLTDFFDFGAKVPSWAVNGSFYLGESAVTAVWLPFFEPALFPRGGVQALLGRQPLRVERPERSFENSMYAVKFSGLVLNTDYSLSYFKGFDDLPVPVPTTDGLVLRFPEMRVTGLDFSGEISAIGFRGEIARFRHETVESEGVVVLSDEPYVKYTVGADYTFRNGIFMGVQLVHGFITERGEDDLNDFLFVTVEDTFLNGDLKTTLTAVREAEGGKPFGSARGTGLFPEISYALVDNLELGGGAFFFGGEDDSVLGAFRKQSQVFVKAKYSL